MTDYSVLLLGIGLGLRHAVDADHVVVMSALVQQERGLWRVVRTAALWGAGHTVAFLALGLLIVLAGLRIPAVFELGAELVVAAMLIGLGLWHLVTLRRQTMGNASALSPVSSWVRPLLVGLIHGLAGSAGIALLAATTIRQRPLAVVYLVLVAGSTVLGMVALTFTVARPIGWTMRRPGRTKHAVTLFAALLSICLGLAVIAKVVASEGVQW